MKISALCLTFAALALIAGGNPAIAATKKSHAKQVAHAVAAPAAPSQKSRLGTDFDFDGLKVGGKYNSADGILTTVEGDKSLDNLLNPRPNFKDRLAVAAESQ